MEITRTPQAFVFDYFDVAWRNRLSDSRLGGDPPEPVRLFSFSIDGGAEGPAFTADTKAWPLELPNCLYMFRPRVFIYFRYSFVADGQAVLVM